MKKLNTSHTRITALSIMILASCKSQPTNPELEQRLNSTPIIPHTTYIFHPPELGTTGEEHDLSDTKNITTLHNTIAARNNQEYLGSAASPALSVYDTTGLTTLPPANSEHAIFLDVYGPKTHTNKVLTSLDRDLKTTVLDLEYGIIRMTDKGNLQSGVMHIENGELITTQDSNVSVKALYVGANSKISGAGHIMYDTEPMSSYGMTFDDLRNHRHERLDWIEDGAFAIGGTVDQLTLTDSMRLRGVGISGKISNLLHNGGTIELRTTSPLKADTYHVNSPSSTLAVYWDTPSTMPLLTVNKEFVLNADLNIKLLSIGSDIQEQNVVTLISSPQTHPNDKFHKVLQKFGAEFTLTSTSQGLQMQLTSLGITPEASRGLSSGATALAQGIFNNSNSHVRQQLIGRDIVPTVNLLNTLMSKGYEPLDLSQAMAFMPIYHQQHRSSATSKIIDSHYTYMNGGYQVNGLEMPISQTTTFAFTTTSSMVIDHHMPQIGVYGTYKDLHCHCYGVSKQFNANIGYRMQNTTFGLHYSHSQNDVNMDTPLGKFQIADMQQLHTVAYCGFSDSIPLGKESRLEWTAQVSMDLDAHIQATDVYIDTEHYYIPKQLLPSRLGLNLNATLTFPCVSLALGGGVYDLSHRSWYQISACLQLQR